MREIEEPLVSSTVAILVLLHFLVFAVPVKSLPLVALAILLTYLHLFWCDAASKASLLKKIHEKTNTSQRGDRARTLVSSTLEFCSKIREQIAQEIARLQKVSEQNQQQNCVITTSQKKITPIKLTSILQTPEPAKSPQLTPDFQRQRSWSDDLSPSKAIKSPDSRKMSKLKRWRRRRKVHSLNTRHLLSKKGIATRIGLRDDEHF